MFSLQNEMGVIGSQSNMNETGVFELYPTCLLVSASCRQCEYVFKSTFLDDVQHFVLWEWLSTLGLKWGLLTFICCWPQTETGIYASENTTLWEIVFTACSCLMSLFPVLVVLCFFLQGLWLLYLLIITVRIIKSVELGVLCTFFVSQPCIAFSSSILTIAMKQMDYLSIKDQPLYQLLFNICTVVCKCSSVNL